ncbi:MAG: hypothetical protein H6Q01_1173 [Acidobacteria bacterium]|jgi:hypothetical protein|nr:hypothetical protein [Acidobacteriota bacterium]
MPGFLTGPLFRFAERLRFPQLFVLTAGLFLLDLIVPDLIPFADEVLLGLLTLLFASWRRKRTEPAPPTGQPGRRPGDDARVVEGQTLR